MGTIYDGNQVGSVFTGNFTANSWERAVAVTVTLNITGGYNSDLYGYLVAPNGTVMMLVNQSANLLGTGMNNVTLTGFTMSSATAFNIGGSYPGAQSLTAYNNPIQNPGTQSVDGNGLLTGVYSPIGSMLYGPGYNPANDLTAGQYANLPAASGVWTLYFADMMQDDGGNGNHTLNSWTLTLAVVPEPVELALGLFAVMLICYAGVKHFWSPKQTETSE